MCDFYARVCVVGALKGQKESDSLNLELQKVVSLQMWMLNSDPLQEPLAAGSSFQAQPDLTALPQTTTTKAIKGCAKAATALAWVCVKLNLQPSFQVPCTGSLTDVSSSFVYGLHIQGCSSHPPPM